MKHAYVLLGFWLTCTAVNAQDALIAKLEERLRVVPTDEEANLQLGKLLCFERGQWQPGLFYLAQGSDKKLRLFAQRDLARPESIDARVAVGDGWWNLADLEMSAAQRNLRLRAAHWYRMVAAETTGLRRGRLESRIRQAGPQP